MLAASTWLKDTLTSRTTGSPLRLEAGQAPTSTTTSSNNENPSMNEEETKKRSDKRDKIYQELVITEKTFNSGLKLAMEVYLPALSQVLKEEEVKLLFGNVKVLKSLSDQLITNLESNPSSKVASVFLNLGPFLKLFCEYCDAHPKRLNLLKEIRERSAVAEVLASLTQNQNQQPGAKQSLESCLILPIQRVPRFVLLLEEIKKSTTSNEEEENVSKALEMVKLVANRVNESLRQRENAEKLCAIQSSLVTLPSATSASRDEDKKSLVFNTQRVFVREDTLSLIASSAVSTMQIVRLFADRKVFLFSDLLLFGPVVGRSVVSPAAVTPSKVETVAEKPNCFKVFHVDESTVVSFQCRDEQTFKMWMEDLTKVVENNRNRRSSTLTIQVRRNSVAGDTNGETKSMIPRKDSTESINSVTRTAKDFMTPFRFGTKNSKQPSTPTTTEQDVTTVSITPTSQSQQLSQTGRKHKTCQSCFRHVSSGNGGAMKKMIMSSLMPLKRRSSSSSGTSSSSSANSSTGGYIPPLVMCAGCSRRVCEDCRVVTPSSSNSPMTYMCFGCEALQRLETRTEKAMEEQSNALKQLMVQSERFHRKRLFALLLVTGGLFLLLLFRVVLFPATPAVDVRLSIDNGGFDALPYSSDSDSASNSWSVPFRVTFTSLKSRFEWDFSEEATLTAAKNLLGSSYLDE